MQYDTLIKNGLFFDGSGKPPFVTNIGISDGRVVSLHASEQDQATQTVDANGLWVLPGMIDIHTHYDIELELAPGLSESVRHGVTSVVMGNCSLSLTMGTAEELADQFHRVETLPEPLINAWLGKAVNWKNSQEYFNHLRSDINMGPNVSALLGHSALRTKVMGLERSLNAAASPSELEEMRRLAHQAIEDGAIGISVDMVPWHMMTGEFKGTPLPSHHATFEEYKMLAEVCLEHDAIFQASPNPQDPMSIVYLHRFAMLGRWGKRLRITILTALDSATERKLWMTFPVSLFFMNRLLGCNIRYQTLTEPFTIYSDGPITPLFEEFSCGVILNNQETTEQRKAVWRSPGFKEKFKDQWLNGRLVTFHRDLDGMVVVDCPDAALIDKSFQQIATEQNKEAIDLFMDLLEEFDTEIRWVSTGGNDRPRIREKLMAHHGILPGFTDSDAHARNLGFYDGPLNIIKQSYQTGFIKPERAIHRVTGEPAEWFRLDTGVLKENGSADVVLLDPQKLNNPISPQIPINDPLLEGAPRLVKREEGDEVIQSVYIKGELVFKEGEAEEALGQQKLGDYLELKAPVSDTNAAVALNETKLRNRIDDTIVDHPFNEYWDIFVLKHTNPVNIGLHVVGVVYWYGLILAALATQNFWLLLLLPISQLIGLVGHWVFEPNYVDTQDAIFSTRASRSLNKLFYKVITGSYQKEVDRVSSQLNQYWQDQGINRQFEPRKGVV